MMPAFLAPVALVLAAVFLAPRAWLAGPGLRRGAVRILLCGMVLVLARYLFWRVTETLPPPGTGSAERAFVWILVVVEILIWIDTVILFATLARPRDNTADADRGEARLRGTATAELPRVDIFIATYNEDLDVLEKTIIGAMAVDWPQDRRRICVLDDGKRDWLRSYCYGKGIDYFTRATNAHAKAGNINAAIARTDGDYFVILDADFVPQRNFLFRAMGLFEDERVGIVQIPHSFYNSDPMQANLGVRHVLPDDQRLFFGTIMPGRDGWGTAFCCGSNSITRRSAMEAIGNALPTGSVTEDMLLTLTLLRKGYVTRYLNERLAIGLAPESLSAMYVQRARWARGAMQILYLKQGPFGPGLRLRDRVMFLPLHWIVQPLIVITTLLTPAICLWTGWSPLPGATVAELVSFQIPSLLAAMAGLRLLAPNAFFPLATTVHFCLQAPRILPTIVATLIRPHGHAFKVTPKGRAAGGPALDIVMILFPTLVIATTALGIWINVDINTRIVDDPFQLPLLIVWAIVSMIILTVVQAAAIAPDGAPSDEMFRVGLPCHVASRPGPGRRARLEEMSLSAARLQTLDEDTITPNVRWIRIDVPDLGAIPAYVVHRGAGHAEIAFHLPSESDTREALVRYLFTSGHDASVKPASSARIVIAMLWRAVRRATPGRIPSRSGPGTPPAWLRAG